MEFSIKNVNAAATQSDCLVVGVYESSVLSEAAQEIDRASKGMISKVLADGDMDGKLEATLMLLHVPGLASNRLLLVGLGKEADFAEKQYAKAVRASIKALEKSGALDATTCLAQLPVKALSAQRKVAYLSEAALDASYKFAAIKRKDEKASPKKGIAKLTINVSVSDVSAAETGLANGQALAAGVSLAKDLGNLPPNVCTPSYLAEQALALGKTHQFKVEVLERDALKKLGMGSFLGVAQGSEEPPKFIIMQHLKGKKEQKPVVLVGKGITFDTGGISLKPGEAMDEMKYDMCGAASVFGTMYAVSLLGLKKNVIGVVPTCENMPSGRATRPGDIVKSMSGQTIEVLNTDAEGRLILCDALTYVERFKPKAVIDVATLTGACIIALGHVHSGLFSDDEVLVKALSKAGHQSLDTVWRLPLDAAYHEQLKSNFADLANIGGRPAGSVTAACFLSRFAEKFRWAHLDIAGTAWKSGAAKGATGRPVPLLLNFLLDQ
jgi:leucyl aminopeptidase